MPDGFYVFYDVVMHDAESKSTRDYLISQGWETYAGTGSPLCIDKQTIFNKFIKAMDKRLTNHLRATGAGE